MYSRARDDRLARLAGLGNGVDGRGRGCEQSRQVDLDGTFFGLDLFTVCRTRFWLGVSAATRLGVPPSGA